ncbi:hypothetical protein CLAFUW4_09328 [Fulvia fulva]|uniref:Uncharacterized protein n=1 Tax=Passalora fulva TaxID=5499 RepID=A0A9Q8UU05_PASFU|nr:uncharacterized protein CLAFUR5_09428 [Fulvia fulva]KAK4614091.1 hypothetical protein CLAFUR4_09334 [Fulvia fulva]KAK4615282.1 hypothetical protein CLAFUR0_09326 [Fulvia fulva]UJO22373.1 hypothetical protein CLAFUR5_09428 [Fulvia fulva]WPV20156.1 hypothetical protein CLAFUW4_09328 [Fulvia fulva]WPV35093.1 hypothetical protein CLAFUW7_09329 [Fulvia fulva]
MAHKGLQILCVILGALLGALLGAVVGAIIFISRPMCVRQLERCRRTLELALGRRKQALELRDFRRLQPRVQALPQELQDMVFEEVIRHDFNRILNKIIVKDDYKPPIALQLHRKLRASFANEYYRTAVVTSLPWSRLKAFLRALPPHHRAMVNSVHMRSPDSKTPVWDRHNMLRETRALMRGSKRKDTCFRRSIGPGTYDWEMTSNSAIMAPKDATEANKLTTSERVQALPQDLQDLIYEHTISHEPTRTITITKDYRPPLQLQLHHKLRQDFATRYYSGANIRVTGFQSKIMPKFLDSLPPGHLSLLRGIEYDR